MSFEAIIQICRITWYHFMTLFLGIGIKSQKSREQNNPSTADKHLAQLLGIASKGKTAHFFSERSLFSISAFSTMT